MYLGVPCFYFYIHPGDFNQIEHHKTVPSITAVCTSFGMNQSGIHGNTLSVFKLLFSK